MEKNSFIYSLFLGLFIVGVVIGFVLGRFSYAPPSQPHVNFTQSEDSSSEANNSQLTENPLIQEVVATVKGKITKFDAETKTITLVDDRNVSGEIKLSDKLLISTIPEDNKPAAPSQDLKSLELDKNCVVTLNRINGSFQATYISYLPVSLSTKK